MVHGQLGSIGLTALQLTATATHLNNGVRVKALAANTHAVYVGLAGVTAGTGYQLSAGNDALFPVIDASTLYVISAGTGDTVCFEGS